MGNNNSLHANTTDELQNFRIDLTKQLPFFLAKATDEYKAFIATDTSTDAKSFAAYQTACRTALNHLQLLIKIAAWAEHTSSKDIMSDSDDNFDQLIMAARDGD